MDGLFGGGGAGNQNTRISAFKVSDAGYGTPIKIGYGSNKVTPVLLWQNDFKEIPHENSGGGKGFGGSSGGVSYTYTLSIIFGVLEGPNNSRIFGKIWRDKKRYENYTKAGFTFRTNGSYPQSAWGYLATKYPEQALAYNGIALLAATNYELSSSATLGQHSIEYFGRCLSSTNTDQNYLDAHIKDVISDFLTNTKYGAIDSKSFVFTVDANHMHDYCVARGLLISPLLDKQDEAHTYLTEWAKVANAGIVYSESKLKLIPYADAAFSNSFGSFAPDTNIRAEFTPNNLLEPPIPENKKPVDCYNKVNVEVLNRGFDYNKVTRDASDQASIENDGLREDPNTIVLNSVCIPRIGSIVAHTQLLRGLYIDKVYTLKTTLDYDFLERMDLITLTDPEANLTNARLRIIQIDDDGQAGVLTIQAEICPWGVSCG